MLGDADTHPEKVVEFSYSCDLETTSLEIQIYSILACSVHPPITYGLDSKCISLYERQSTSINFPNGTTTASISSSNIDPNIVGREEPYCFPRQNLLLICSLWQNGEFQYYPEVFSVSALSNSNKSTFEYLFNSKTDASDNYGDILFGSSTPYVKPGQSDSNYSDNILQNLFSINIRQKLRFPIKISQLCNDAYILIKLVDVDSGTILGRTAFALFSPSGHLVQGRQLLIFCSSEISCSHLNLFHKTIQPLLSSCEQHEDVVFPRDLLDCEKKQSTDSSNKSTNQKLLLHNFLNKQQRNIRRAEKIFDLLDKSHPLNQELPSHSCCHLMLQKNYIPERFCFHSVRRLLNDLAGGCAMNKLEEQIVWYVKLLDLFYRRIFPSGSQWMDTEVCKHIKACIRMLLTEVQLDVYQRYEHCTSSYVESGMRDPLNDAGIKCWTAKFLYVQLPSFSAPVLYSEARYEDLKHNLPKYGGPLSSYLSTFFVPKKTEDNNSRTAMWSTRKANQGSSGISAGNSILHGSLVSLNSGSFHTIGYGLDDYQHFLDNNMVIGSREESPSIVSGPLPNSILETLLKAADFPDLPHAFHDDSTKDIDKASNVSIISNISLHPLVLDSEYRNIGLTFHPAFLTKILALKWFLCSYGSPVRLYDCLNAYYRFDSANNILSNLKIDLKDKDSDKHSNSKESTQQTLEEPCHNKKNSVNNSLFEREENPHVSRGSTASLTSLPVSTWLPTSNSNLSALVSVLPDDFYHGFYCTPVELKEPENNECIEQSRGSNHYFVDYNIFSEHPASMKYLKLMRAEMLKTPLEHSCCDIRPTVFELKKLSDLIKCPMQPLSVEGKQLLWRFRWNLVDEKRALSKFLRAVDWNDTAETKHAFSLLHRWAKPEVDDALELLLGDFSSSSGAIRRYAVSVLENASENELRLYLLQLVQALRYEHPEDCGDSSQAPLLSFLIQRAQESVVLATYLYWYLQCEMEDQEKGHLFVRAHQRFVEHLRQSTANSGDILSILVEQEKLREKLLWVCRAGGDRRDKIERKTEKLREALFLQFRYDNPTNTSDSRFVPDNDSLSLYSIDNLRIEELQLPVAVPLPVDPNVLLVGIIPDECFVMRSSMYPVVFSCSVNIPIIARNKTIRKHDVIEPHPETTSSQLSNSQINVCGTESMSENRLFPFPRYDSNSHIKYITCKKKYLYKLGDDLRQDQLIIQMITLMDSLLKKYGLDLKLTPYKVVAMSTQDGMIEFVPDAEPLSSIKKHYKGGVRQFFATAYAESEKDPFSENKDSPLGFPDDVLDTFIRSCAGYCVITFLLGIGDRHLDNLLVDRGGHLFHIDFGFILGEDPKPLPPPMKLCREMVEAMGGANSEGYNKFRWKCCQAYKYLRQNAKLIINLLSLMADAGIKDMKMDPGLAVWKVQEKFRLDLNDEAAEAYLLNVINASVKALFPAVVDKLHEWAIYWK